MRLPPLFACLVVAAVHLALARVSMALTGDATVSPIWIPAGVDATLLVLLGRRAWPGVVAGELLANATSALPLAALLPGAAANALAAVVAASVIVRCTSAPIRPAHVRDVLAPVLLAAPLAALCSATVGVSGLAAAGALDAGGFALAWRTWFLGDVAGIAVLTPGLLILVGPLVTLHSKDRSPPPGKDADPQESLSDIKWSRGEAERSGDEAAGRGSAPHGGDRRAPISGETSREGPLAGAARRLPARGRAAEAAALVVALTGACALAFGGGADETYAVFPVIVWAALRFRLVGAAVTSLAAATVAVVATANGQGPFATLDDTAALLQIQGFLAVSTMTGLLLAIVSDERESAQRQLAHRATHDALTGLPNRALLDDRLDAALARGARDGSHVALVLVDLDQFKNVNDSLGHHAGDELLTLAAPRLRAAARPQDTVARFGGDEFVVLCEDLAGPWEAQMAAERLAAAWTEPFRLGDDDVFVSGSAGVAVTHGGRADAQVLLREADAAMYRAKERGRGHVELYDEVMRARAYDRLRLEGDLRRALADGEITVAFQPILDLQAGRPVAVEALARWEHPERGWLSPATFIPMAEESGLIAELGRHVLWTACRELARWRAEIPGAADLQISVNVSARQIARGELPGDVRDALRAAGLPPTALALEITESTLMEEWEAPGPVLAALRSLGVGIVLDDFGTGYSSLSYLRRFPLDGLKLDRSFVDGLAEPHAAAVVEAIVGMGATLGLTVTAEGLETREQAERLRALGCPRGQGYILARPLTADAVGPVLAAGLRRRSAPAAGPQVRTARNES